jgi:chemotaxis protein MotA
VPAFGIVVAVMGVVNVMGSVGEPPAVLGKMIGGALVGTFLGILIATASFAGGQPARAEGAGGHEDLSGDQGRPAGVDVGLCAAGGGRVRAQGAGLGCRPTFRELEEELKARKGK